jgi:hypothetical protein
MKRYVFSLFFAVALALGLSSGVKAQEQSEYDVTPLSLTALKTFGNAVTISTHGNVIQFESPLGFEHIAIGDFHEGYVLCNGGTNRYDLGSSENGFANPITANCPSSTTCTVTRNTSDGLLQLKQDFKFVSAERRLEITMTVKNLSGFAIGGVKLRRQADFDVDNTTINNHAATEQDAYFAWTDETDSGSVSHGMILRHVKPNALRQAKVNFFESTCSPADQASGNPIINDDYTGTIEYDLGTINAGASKSVTIQYERHM